MEEEALWVWVVLSFQALSERGERRRWGGGLMLLEYL